MEFNSGNQEYDYEIDALSGSILEYNTELRDHVPAGNAVSSDSKYIGEEKAKEIALKHAELSASAVTRMTVKFDYDDGVAVYDVGFYKGSTEYDYEINALTGTIIEYDRDYEDDGHHTTKPATTKPSGNTPNTKPSGNTPAATTPLSKTILAKIKPSRSRCPTQDSLLLRLPG